VHDLRSPHETSILSKRTQAGRDWPVKPVIRAEAPVRTLRDSARPPQRYANYTPGFWPRICHMGKTAASTGIVPMAFVAFEQYFPKAQGVIDDGLAADRPTAGTYTRGANGLRREGVIPNID